MSTEIKADQTLDLKGLACPMPVVKISKGIKDVEIGQVVRAVTTDPGSLMDFPAWAKSNGQEIIKTLQEDNEITFYIKRIK